MAWVKPTSITSWSFSRYSTYKLCPLKAKLTIIDKMKEPKGEALIRGAAIHDVARDYLRGEGRAVPVPLKGFTDEFKRLRSVFKRTPDLITVEDDWAFNRTWGLSRWDDWTNCWVRIKLDVSELRGDVVEITDHKTGKFRPDNQEDYLEQLELYELGGLLTYLPRNPNIQVTSRLLYLDAGVVYPAAGDARPKTAADLPKLKKTWEARVRPMLNDRKFAPRPNNMCRFCAFRKDAGGPCVY